MLLKSAWSLDHDESGATEVKEEVKEVEQRKVAHLEGCIGLL